MIYDADALHLIYWRDARINIWPLRLIDRLTLQEFQTLWQPPGLSRSLQVFDAANDRACHSSARSV